MPILIKCNASDLVQGDTQTFTMRKEKGIGLIRGEEVFVWISEQPREGRPDEPGGLRMRGEIIDWEATGGKTTVLVRVTERLSEGVGMDALLSRDRGLEASPNFRKKMGFRHRRIWGLSPNERQAFHSVFAG
jgi:hypothetical protein